jgi:ATP synthase protein I
LQAGLASLVAAGAYILFGELAARSALLGGLTGFIPNACFAWIFGRGDPRRAAKEVVTSFYWGEAIKLLSTALLFVVVFQLPNIQFLPMFAGFIAALMVFWLALLLRN